MQRHSPLSGPNYILFSFSYSVRTCNNNAYKCITLFFVLLLFLLFFFFFFFFVHMNYSSPNYYHRYTTIFLNYSARSFPSDLNSMNLEATLNQERRSATNQSGLASNHDRIENIIDDNSDGKGMIRKTCDLFDGRWIRDDEESELNDNYPLYVPEDCPFIDPGFRCQENGRPDSGYARWRWQPYGCNLPRFNGSAVLERMQGRRIVFVGDSIGRNQWESMLCMLASAMDADKRRRIYEVDGQPITKHSGSLAFRFPDHNNMSIEYFRSPFLVPLGRPPSTSSSSSSSSSLVSQNVSSTLRLDHMDWSSPRWIGADLLIFNTGHWWTFEKIMRGGCYFQIGDKVNKSMGIEDGFKVALRTWREWVDKELDPRRTAVFFRTYSPTHFSGGTWRSGGGCHQETQPWATGTKFEEEEPWTNKHVRSETQRLQDAGVRVLEVTNMSNYRKDAHSSIYHVGKEQPRPMRRQDCSHWCLPGLPDAWNELLFASFFSMINPNETYPR